MEKSELKQFFINELQRIRGANQEIDKALLMSGKINRIRIKLGLEPFEPIDLKYIENQLDNEPFPNPDEMGKMTYDQIYVDRCINFATCDKEELIKKSNSENDDKFTVKIVNIEEIRQVHLLRNECGKIIEMKPAAETEKVFLSLQFVMGTILKIEVPPSILDEIL